MSVLIVGFNFILRNIIIELIRWFGKKTRSKGMDTILRITFTTQFFNTAVLTLLVHSNFSNSSAFGINKVFNGDHPDFTMEWYFKVGVFFSQTLIILGFAPLIDVVSGTLRMRVFQKLDIGTIKSQNKSHSNKTKVKTVQYFVNTYAGPELMLHYRYANLMISIAMPMMYGFGVPVLFPIAFVNLCI